MKFAIRDLLWLAVVVALVIAGCGRRAERRFRQVQQGIEDVEKHAKEIEQAAKSPNSTAPAPNLPSE